MTPLATGLATIACIAAFLSLSEFLVGLLGVFSLAVAVESHGRGI